MSEADALTIENGVSGFDLMKTAGRAVFDRLITSFPDAASIHVICGPGNNGGDGYIVAELLRQAGREVKVSSVTPIENLSGDAALAHRHWRGGVVPFHPGELDDVDLIVDALFGAGLSRPVEGEALDWITAINEADVPVLSIDLPSGVNGDTGEAGTLAIAAVETVTFFRKKPGHLLNPGKALCGLITVADIGIADDVFRHLDIDTFENAPGLWQAQWPGYVLDGHKYERGHAIIVSGGEFTTGASRLTASAALRIGAGLTSIAGSADAIRVHAAHLTSVMLKPFETPAELAALLTDKRITAVAAGPGLGLDDTARDKLACILESPPDLVLDADALTLGGEHTDLFLERLSARQSLTVLTPHMGEYARLFGTPAPETLRIDLARSAAERSGAIIVLKGADTIIAEPGGRVAINGNAPPWLATAGSGDVLTGMIAGLRAQGMPAFEAACAGVWLHGEAAKRCGAYLIAEELETGLKQVLEEDSFDWAEDTLPDDESDS
ncbi:MAG: bifunctional ADP-dependent NAD(P)H-hydrate dehydratase/NAD(P)H-hydrate epimerase [Ponticaulis sp.]|nr:bifunctional ADP-dependent NAD(P)H-hydrate dehydratase/NAD(P)H-hydrate epimerase [Ponticaulis sp.]